MLGITDLPTYIIGTIFIILVPGPNSLYVLSVAAKRGVRAGYQGAAAVVVGDAVLMVLAAAGIGSLLAAYPSVFTVTEAVNKPADTRHPFKRALAISLVNPKAILFFVSFFIQFVDPAYPYPALTFAALGAILQIISIIYLSALILIGARVAETFRQRHRLSAAMTGGVGGVFIGFGAKLATATL